MAYSSIAKPTDYFETKLHNGTGVSKTLSYDFEVDFFWTKKRNDVYGAYMFDSVRGNNIRLQVSQTNAENTAGNTISFGNSSGVTIGSDSGNYGVNQPLTDGGDAATYVGWGWKASGSTASNSDGSITSTVSANTTAGFSIVSYTGTGSNATVGHGLGAAPAWIIFKRRDSADNWTVYHQSISPTKRIELNSSGAAATSSASFNDTAPTTSVFSIGNNSALNASSGTNIAYCFVEKQGYSKFGSYTGNGNASGAFIYTGFKPAMVILKVSGASDAWNQFDNKRLGFNVDNNPLFPSATTVEQTSDNIDILSNGFKLRTTDNGLNGSGTSYLYMAFAENPFVANDSGTAVPVTAR